MGRSTARSFFLALIFATSSVQAGSFNGTGIFEVIDAGSDQPLALAGLDVGTIHPLAVSITFDEDHPNPLTSVELTPNGYGYSADSIGILAFGAESSSLHFDFPGFNFGPYYWNAGSEAVCIVCRLTVELTTILGSSDLPAEIEPVPGGLVLEIIDPLGWHVRGLLVDFEYALAMQPAELISDLTSEVLSVNLAAGITSSLDAKLDSALLALDDVNENNDSAALNSIYAFCNSVEAQRGHKLTIEQADQLIASANSVITALDGGAFACQ